MYIKEVNISGFRSYRDVTTIDDFSRKHNVVVGRNGSGKSNFFFAIQFVLSEEYAHMKSDFKVGLLHEGTGPRIATARVEIVFDNSDRRIVANDSNEVRVMRQIGNKKDQYYIDNKVVTRADVVNLMESAGFSRSNPYYIVKQGKINELATAPDAHRLKLLREVAGTRVYDERKEESEKILEETLAKRQKVESLISFIEDRLKTLESEKEDLKEYQKWDKTKRSVEYTIFEQEMRDAKDKLESLAQEREEINKKQNTFASNLVDVQSKGLEEAKMKRNLDQEFKKIREEKETLSSEKEKLVARRAELQLQITDLDDDVTRSREHRQKTKEKLEEAEEKIRREREKLESLRPQYEELVAREEQLKTDLRIADERCKTLFAKQGDTSRFKSTDERRAFFAKELRRVRGKKHELEEQIEGLDREIKEHEEQLEQVTNQHENLKHDMESISDQLTSASDEIQRKRNEEQALVAKMQETEREDRDIRDSLNQNDADKQRLSYAQRQLGARTHVQGMENLKAMIEELRNDPRHQGIVDGYLGHIIDHLECDSVYYQAVEAACGNRIYNTIVDTDRTAITILKMFNERKMNGELNFIPLNRIQRPEVREVEDDEARHMLDVISFPDKLRPAFEFIFGKTAIIRGLEVGVRVAKTFGVDCITLEGDQVARRGAMTGGYQDAKSSKLEARQKLKDLDKKREQYEGNLHKVEERKRAHHKALQDLRNTLNKLDNSLRQFRSEHGGSTDNKRALLQQMNELQRRIEMKKNELTRERQRLREMEREEGYLVAEEQKSLSSQLSSQESDEIAQLQAEIRESRSELQRVSDERANKEREKVKTENLLNSTLLRRKEEYEAILNDISSKEKNHQLTSERVEFSSVSARITEITKRLGEIDERLDEYDNRNEEIQLAIDNYADQQRALEASISDLSRQADSIVTRQSTLQTIKEEASKKARELGTLPVDAFSKYNHMSRHQLDKKLAECMRELKKYENVNKKALDQFVQASQQKEELTVRLSEQVTNEKSIRDLIDVLDHRKYDAIRLTFKQVTKNFMDVFHELVPHGQGCLVWRASDQSTQNDDSQPDQEVSRDTIDNFIGIGIKVSFGGQEGTREMQQLSGGQKSLVALALIFAIQKCDPAPFYLFDEIDAALDQQHRKAVADMIEKLSSNAQFITTTFRPELLEHAEKCYGVIFRNKVSHIKLIDKTQAYDFVEDDATHG